MKWLCILLLLLNAVYLGWEVDRHARSFMQAHEHSLRVPAHVPTLTLLREMEQPPNKRRAAPPPVMALPDTEAEPVAQEIDDTLGLVMSLPGISTTTPDVPLESPGLSTGACFSFGPFTEGSAAAQLHDWLHQHRSPVHLRRETGQEDQLFWVYLAPREGAVATFEELRDHGVQDVSLIRTGHLQNTISLGLFSTQAAVNRRLQELQGLGYQAIVVPYNDDTTVYWVDTRISRSDIIDAIHRQYPAGLNYLPLRCEAVAALSGAP